MISPRMIKMEILVALYLTRVVVIATVEEINVDPDPGEISLYFVQDKCNDEWNMYNMSDTLYFREKKKKRYIDTFRKNRKLNNKI